MRVTLIDNYDSFTFNLVHFLGELGAEVSVWRNDARSVEETLADEPDAIVLSPGPCTPNEAGICLDLVRAARGDDADPRRLPRPSGDRPGVRRPGDPRAAADARQGVDRQRITRKKLFRGVNGPFQATRYHSLVVERASAPDELEVTAEADGLIMAMSHRRLNVHGVQFHPESIASEHGKTILGNFLDLARAAALSRWKRSSRSSPRSPPAPS